MLRVPHTTTWAERLGWPSLGDHRRFVTAIAIDAVGSGVFMPVSVLYFLATTDLGLVQVGAALSLAALVALPAGPLLGGVVDRFGAKSVLLAGNALQGSASWPTWSASPSRRWCCGPWW